MVYTMTDICSSLNSHPEVFEFMRKILHSQIACPGRFQPRPAWVDTVGGMDKFAREMSMINTEAWKNKYTRDQDLPCPDTAAMLHCPLRLEHVALATGTSTWQQYLVTWSEPREQSFEQTGVPQYLYHGSPLSNWYSIIHNGLKNTSGTDWMTTGAVYGNGVYCSDNLGTSWGYCGCYSEIVMGVYEVYDAAQYKKTTNIFVVPNADKLLLRYLIYLPRHTDFTQLGQAMSHDWQKRGQSRASVRNSKQKKVEARVLREIAIMQHLGHTVQRIDACTLQVDTYVVYLPHCWPFSAPSIDGQLCEWNVRSTIADCLPNSPPASTSDCLPGSDSAAR